MPVPSTPAAHRPAWTWRHIVLLIVGLLAVAYITTPSPSSLAEKAQESPEPSILNQDPSLDEMQAHLSALGFDFIGGLRERFGGWTLPSTEPTHIHTDYQDYGVFAVGIVYRTRRIASLHTLRGHWSSFLGRLGLASSDGDDEQLTNPGSRPDWIATDARWYLGLLGFWIPIPESFSMGDLSVEAPWDWSVEWMPQDVHVMSSFCYYNGFRLWDSLCACLPSYHGSRCQWRIHAFRPISAALERIRFPSEWIPALLRRIGLLDVILAVNLVVFAMWQLCPEAWMRAHFTHQVPAPPNSFSLHTWLTSNYSHRNVFHLANNMRGFVYVAPVVYSMVGESRFGVLFLAACVLSSLGSWIYRTHLRHQTAGYSRSVSCSLGASGCVLALETFLLAFHASPLGEEESMGFLLAQIFWDAVVQQGHVDLGGHVGGILAGWLLALHWG
ncbi:uncharacterized protein BJ171DRAFT_492431 [Polychytrium aggregatum]|uniref:uncharacterized protein n=1 Tax=Polychytrium aggregatum TaxID=110093 RepID=UPI0022FED351|nr:uncharacterized protein BJ171DRAFT_492431 [Polychytrium aggregatum]KAI9208033.1 hypothetical protein BJ171DRAFT_492431 [Polychytrium aggregatum]